jgi:uncharacterized protein
VVDVDVRRWAETAPVPWKNGAGLTRELLSWPPGGGSTEFDYRISVADVDASGPFSTFDGVDRVIVLVEGPAMVLTVGTTTRALTRFVPFGFDGGLATSCRIPDGPTRDLNIMTRRDRCRASVQVIELAGPTTFEPPGARLVVSLAHRLRVWCDAAGEVSLDRFDVVRVGAGASVALHGTAPVAVIEIVPAAGAADTR